MRKVMRKVMRFKNQFFTVCLNNKKVKNKVLIERDFALLLSFFQFALLFYIFNIFYIFY